MKTQHLMLVIGTLLAMVAVGSALPAPVLPEDIGDDETFVSRVVLVHESDKGDEHRADTDSQPPSDEDLDDSASVSSSHDTHDSSSLVAALADAVGEIMPQRRKRSQEAVVYDGELTEEVEVEDEEGEAAIDEDAAVERTVDVDEELFQ